MNKTYKSYESSEISKIINAVVVPRPIAFITSMHGKVVNAAPFSYFNVVCSNPAILSIAIQRRDKHLKDTARNILELKEFVVNICSLNLAKEMSLASGDFPPEVSEIELANLTLEPSEKISVPRIKEAPVQMECLLDQVIHVREHIVELILGKVLKVHVHKDVLDESGKIDILKLNPLARLAGLAFGKVELFCELPRGKIDQ